MRRNKFGDPRPKGSEEMADALEEKGWEISDGELLNAEIDHNSDGGEYDGYTAEVRENDNGNEVFATLGYADRADLVKDLEMVGITDISDL